MIINDEYILDKYWKGKQCSFLNVNPSKILLCERYWISHRFFDSKDPLEVLYRLKNNISIRPVCPICGNPVKWDKYLKYTKYCSKKCANKNVDLIEKRKNTFIERYGVNCPSKINGFSEKSKQTKLERYGDENFNNPSKRKETNIIKYDKEFFVNPEKSKQTKLERYGDENFNNPEKSKQTKLERYGDENFNNPEKSKQTKLERYGDENFNNPEKSQITCLLKYGVLSPLQNKDILKKLSDTCMKKYGVKYSVMLELSKENSKKVSIERYGKPYPFMNSDFRKDAASMVTEESTLKRICTSRSRFGTDNFNNRIKSKETCLKRYGVESYTKTNEWKSLMSNMMSSTKMQQRRHDTMERNHSFNSSKPEEQLFLYIKEKFPLVKRQYRDSLRYPYNCDFYIPELDLFLELNGNWTHGKHPFDVNSKEDQLILEGWKLKRTKYYDNAIETWTKRDVKKREIAKENGLNFKEVWSLEEGISFINTL